MLARGRYGKRSSRGRSEVGGQRSGVELNGIE